jgi:hypothetical protein
MNEKGEITLLTSENIKPYFIFIIFRVRFAPILWRMRSSIQNYFEKVLYENLTF